MPKDRTKNIDRYKIQGGHLNEFEYTQQQQEMAGQYNETADNLIPGTPPEARADPAGESEAQALETESTQPKKIAAGKKATPTRKTKPAKKAAPAKKRAASKARKAASTKAKKRAPAKKTAKRATKSSRRATKKSAKKTTRKAGAKKAKKK